MPTLIQRRSSRKMSILTAGTSNWTEGGTHKSSADEAIKKALVINFRRLITLKEKLDIIHEVIRATTIALLGLTVIGNARMLLYDVVFLALNLALCTFHEKKFGALNTDDFSQIVNSVGNDGDDILQHTPTGACTNPNRCLQAMDYSGRRDKGFSFLLVLFFIVLCLGIWTLAFCWWDLDMDAEEYTVFGADEVEHYATLLLVGTVMVYCHLVFEFFTWREFQFSAPLKKDGQPWDVSRDGIPPGRLNSIFGLPCLWFSSPAAYEDLRVWVTLAGPDVAGLSRTYDTQRPLRAVRRVVAEELAFYAMREPSCAAQVRQCLLSAKLYDKRNRIFLKRPLLGEVNAQGRPGVRVTGLRAWGAESRHEDFFQVDLKNGEPPSELGLELVFFDSRTGELIVPNMPGEIVDEGGMDSLRHGSSPKCLRIQNTRCEMVGCTTSAA